jgi:hypothetical protein
VQTFNNHTGRVDVTVYSCPNGLHDESYPATVNELVKWAPVPQSLDIDMTSTSSMPPRHFTIYELTAESLPVWINAVSYAKN